jgi:peptidyl-tRNA hydrolase
MLIFFAFLAKKTSKKLAKTPKLAYVCTRLLRKEAKKKVLVKTSAKKSLKKVAKKFASFKIVSIFALAF